MIPQPLSQALDSTLADGKLSQGERQALSSLLEGFLDSEDKRNALLHAMGELAVKNLADHRDEKTVQWLLQIVRLFPKAKEKKGRFETWFCPGEEATSRIIQLLDSARTTLDICVFTITDDRITQAILRANSRGVRLRVISDDEKALDLGSDVNRLVEVGVQVRTDRVPAHMHHKFALFDEEILVTGSFNWTRGATMNVENLLVTDEQQLVEPYTREFERLWKTLGH